MIRTPITPSGRLRPRLKNTLPVGENYFFADSFFELQQEFHIEKLGYLVTKNFAGVGGLRSEPELSPAAGAARGKKKPKLQKRAAPQLWRKHTSTQCVKTHIFYQVALLASDPKLYHYSFSGLKEVP